MPRRAHLARSLGDGYEVVGSSSNVDARDEELRGRARRLDLRERTRLDRLPHLGHPRHQRGAEFGQAAGGVAPSISGWVAISAWVAISG